jgi:SpoVK/Ycf46/Vps4 family AAA+-type ATPase
MDIKELFKFQMMTQMGGANSQNNNTGLKQAVLNLFFMMIMSAMDDIIKALSKIFNETKESFSDYFQKKVTDKIELRPKELSDNSITLSTRHNVNTFVMTRTYSKLASSTGSTNISSNVEISEETNSIIDSIITQMTKLDNIPTLNLIDKGNVIMTYKDKPIQITKDIYAKIDNINISTSGTVESIKLSLLSNILSAAEISSYVKKIYNNHLQDIKNALGDNIYYFDQKQRESSMPPLPGKGTPDEMLNQKIMKINTAPKQLSFTMTPFYSNKSFSNIYGPEIRLIEKRIRFFMNNKDWYDRKGIPYQLGLLLSGIPGGGKTSVVRAIANLTKRHIINVNFANITTATQLKNLFYSEKLQVYSDNTMANTQSYVIPMSNKIFLLEELDAIGDIVKQRTECDTEKKIVNDELTLMEILTVFDGTMETPGRIMILTSNHPEFLDEALIRPGRIDAKVNFNYACRDLIVELFAAYFDEDLPEKYVKMLPNKLLSPAEVGQVLFKYFDTDYSYEQIINDLNKTSKIHEKKRIKNNLFEKLNVDSDNTSAIKEDPIVINTSAIKEDPIVINTSAIKEDPIVPSYLEKSNKTEIEEKIDLDKTFNEKNEIEKIVKAFYEDNKKNIIDLPDKNNKRIPREDFEKKLVSGPFYESIPLKELRNRPGFMSMYAENNSEHKDLPNAFNEKDSDFLLFD